MNSIHRRQLLGQACSFGSVALGATLPGEPDRKLKVVVTGGHPGDPEYGCGGTIARYSDLGHDVVLLYLNDGVPAGKPKDGVRIAEAGKACEILKARPIFAGQVDADAVVNSADYEAFRKIVEAEQPDVVFTHWPIDNHADHRAMSMLVYEAWLRLARRFALYYYEVSNGEDTVQFAPTHYVDITETVPRKRQACFAHASQSPQKFYALQEQITRLRGSSAAAGTPRDLSGTFRTTTSGCRWPNKNLGADANRHARDIAGQIAPQKSESEDQPAQRCLADRVDPGRMVQLAELDGERQAERQHGNADGRRSRQDESDGEKRGERPQRIAGIGSDELGQDASVAARADPGYDDQNDPNDLATAISPSSVSHDTMVIAIIARMRRSSRTSFRAAP